MQTGLHRAMQSLPPSQQHLPSSVMEVLSQDSWFSLLPDDLQDGMVDIARLKTLKAGEMLCYRGQAASGLYALVQGGVLVFKEMRPGDGGLLMRMTPCGWIGEAGLFDGLCHTHNIKVDVDSLFVHFPMNLLWRLLESAPHHWKWMGMLTSQRLRISYAALDELSPMSTEIRLARRLVYMAVGVNLNGEPSAVRIHQRQLAEMLGVSRTSIAGLLKNMKEQGLVRLSYGRIEILDIEAMKKLGGAEHALPLAAPPRK